MSEQLDAFDLRSGKTKKASSSSLDLMVGQMLSSQTKQLDDLIRTAVTKCLGDDWRLTDLKGRCECVRILHSKVETMMLDGKPILEIHDPEFDFSDPKNVRSTMNYRILV